MAWTERSGSATSRTSPASTSWARARRSATSTNRGATFRTWRTPPPGPGGRWAARRSPPTRGEAARDGSRSGALLRGRGGGDRQGRGRRDGGHRLGLGQVEGDDHRLKPARLVRGVAERLVRRLAAAAQRNLRAAGKPERLALLVHHLEIPLDAQGAVVHHGDLRRSHRNLRSGRGQNVSSAAYAARRLRARTTMPIKAMAANENHCPA